MCHGVNKIQKKDWKIQDSESRNSEFRKLQNSESGNWTGKLQDSEFRKPQNSETSEFRIQETGPGNFRIQNSGNLRIQNTSELRIQETGPGNYSSESRKLDRETSGFRIQNSEFRKLQNSESGNWTGKLQNSENFRIQNWETGPGNFRIQNSGNLRIQNTSEFRIHETGPGNFRIQETGFQNLESGNCNSESRKLDREIIILKVGIQNSGNWTGKLQNSENSEFRIQETSEFRKVDAIRYAIVFHWFWSVGLSPKTPPGRLKTLLLRRPFYTLRRQRSANQRSPMPTRHLADQSAIASRQTPLFSERSDLSFALRKYLLN